MPTGCSPLMSARPRDRATSSSAGCRVTIRGCRTCCARSSKPRATASSATRTMRSRPGHRFAGRRGSEDAPRTTIWLRTEPEPPGKKDDSIYRYDRAGLLMALKSRGEGQMNELLLVVTIAGERVALPAAAVESVVELDTLIPVPRAAPHVAGLSALRSRVLTVIDCMRSLELGDDRLLRRHPRSGRGRARRPSLCADRRSGRRRGRGLVRAGAGARRDGRRAGSASRRAWSRPRSGRCC